jgi:hypothetical protein
MIGVMLRALQILCFILGDGGGISCTHSVGFRFCITFDLTTIVSVGGLFL